MASSIEKGLIIYHKHDCSPENREKAIKYRLFLSLIRYENYSTRERRISKRVIKSQASKNVVAVSSSYHFGRNQDSQAKDLQMAADKRKLRLHFFVDWDWDFYKSESSIDSQYAVYSDGQEDSEDSENELDETIQPPLVRKNLKIAKRMFKQAKRVTHLSLAFSKMNPNHDRVFRYLPLLNKLEDCQISIRMIAPSDIIALRDFFKLAKQRNSFPRIKSLIVSLRHSYNKEHCSARFIRFCQILREMAEITRDLPRVRLRLKVKYMWRLDESAIDALRETLETAQDQLIKLSFVANQAKKLKPLFKGIEGMKNLDKFSIRLNESCDIESVYSLKELSECLKKIESLRRVKIQGKGILDKLQNEELSTKGLIAHLGNLSQITSFNFVDTNQNVDETLCKCFSNSISQLSQLRVLILKNSTYAQRSATASPNLNGFLDFFVRLKSLQNLRIFTFHMSHPYYECLVKDHNHLFKAACEALQDQKKLRELNFVSPWVSNLNLEIQELTNVLANLQELESFSFGFSVPKSIGVVENDTFMQFAKAICCLKTIRYFSIYFQIKEVNNLTYEAALIAFKHFQKRNASCRIHIASNQIEEESEKRLTGLKGFYVRKN